MTATERLKLVQILVNCCAIVHNRASQLEGLDRGAKEFSGKVPKTKNDKLLKEYNDALNDAKKCIAKL